MKRCLIFFIIITLVIFDYQISSTTQTDDFSSQDVFIYQISPKISNQIKTSYSTRTNYHTYDDLKVHNISNYDAYILLTTEVIAEEIKSSPFITWKQSLGYNVKIVNITDSLIQEQNGNDLAERIRNFLREYHPIWMISSLLIIGDIYTIPMKYCYPNPQNHNFDIFDYTSGEVPTDYYYADLSASDNESWDLDGDGYYGEYNQDQPDFLAEITVGRIPINDITRIIYTLDKTVNFEHDTSPWKNNALHAGAFFYFTEEIQGNDAMDGAVLSYQIEEDIMNGWTINHYSEQEGIELSKYDWPALSEEAFINDWRNNKYSIVNWQGHGWTDRVARKVWTNDNGDNIPQGNEILWPNFIHRSSNLDDDYPSIVTAVSCYVGCPEPDPNTIGNLGIDLLTDPSFGAGVAVVASARTPYGSSTWPNTPGGSEQIIYEFNKNIIINNETIGEALYNSKYYCNTQYGWDNYAEYIDMFTFNLFGDPTLYLNRRNGNQPPNNPACSYDKLTDELVVKAIDPDGDQIRYGVDWNDDMSIGQWTSLAPSGTEQRINCGGRKGTINVLAEDEYGAQSDWVSQKTKYKVFNIQSLFFQFIENHPYLFPLLRQILGL